MIPSLGRFGKEFIDVWFVPAVIVLVGVAAFGLGRLSATTHGAVGQGQLRIYQQSFPAAAAATNAAASDAEAIGERRYVASKNGTKYYLPECSGASRINEENKVWFATAAEAERSGYTPAAHCPGL